MSNMVNADFIQEMIDAHKEIEGTEPNRVRMSHPIYSALFAEIVMPLVKGMAGATVGPLEEIHGLTIEVVEDARDDYIMVDRRPENDVETHNGARVAQFHCKVTAAVSELAFVMMPGYDSSELVLDGRFTLEQLEQIVAAWKQYKEESTDAEA